MAACSSGSPAKTSNNGGGNNNGGGRTTLSAGLSANLDQLASYKFSWNYFGASTGGAGSPMETGSFAITGTVINSPPKSISVSYFGVQYIQIADQQWSSFDGTTWMATDASSAADLSTMLPTSAYGSWFDTNSGQFSSAGDETKNGVACVHYKGNDSLSGLYSKIAGVSASFQADLWVAKDGNYPVSGAYGFTTSSAGQAGTFGYTFDITNINDSSNKIDPPTNVQAMPS